MIMQTITDFMFRSVAPRDIRYVKRPDLKRMDTLAAQVSQQMAQEFQLAPPLTLHHLLPRVMAGLWAISREAYIAGHTGRALREAVASEISKINQCPYCVDVHTAMLHGLGNGEVAQAIVYDKDAMDGVSRDVVDWATANLSPKSNILRRPPFTANDAPKFIGTALLFHYLNRMAHLFLPDSPLPVPSSFAWLKRNLGIVFGKTVGSKIATLTASSDTFPLADEVTALPPEFNWALADERIAAAFSLFAKVIEEAGAFYIDVKVRELLLSKLDQWQGDQPGLGQAWLEESVTGQDKAQRPAARLALLTAFTSYQVNDSDIASFREQTKSDAALIALTSWASFQAMKKVSTWLHAPEKTTSSNEI